MVGYTPLLKIFFPNFFGVITFMQTTHCSVILDRDSSLVCCGIVLHAPRLQSLHWHGCVVLQRVQMALLWEYAFSSLVAVHSPFRVVVIMPRQPVVWVAHCVGGANVASSRNAPPRVCFYPRVELHDFYRRVVVFR